VSLHRGIEVPKGGSVFSIRGEKIKLSFIGGGGVRNYNPERNYAREEAIMRRGRGDGSIGGRFRQRERLSRFKRMIGFRYRMKTTTTYG